MLRIAHVTATIPPYVGGTRNVAWYLTRELAPRGHDVHVLTADLGGDKLGPEGARVRRLRYAARRGGRYSEARGRGTNTHRVRGLGGSFAR